MATRAFGNARSVPAASFCVCAAGRHVNRKTACRGENRRRAALNDSVWTLLLAAVFIAALVATRLAAVVLV